MNPQRPIALEPAPVLRASDDSRPRRNRAPELALAILFLVLVASVFVIQTTVEIHRGEGISALEVFRQKPTAAHLRAYEHGLEDASVVARALRPWVQFAQFAWFRDGGEKALVGRDGWLFYKPGFDDMVSRGSGNPRATDDAVAAIVAWRDALAARGIQLLVMPAPNKESIYPDYLTRRVEPGQTLMSPPTRDLLQRLQSANVECVDLFALFAARTNAARAGAPSLYLERDSHWSPAGVALAAHAVAQRLAEKGWVKPSRTAYYEKPMEVERPGDVVRMLQSAQIERSTVPEKVPCVQVVREDGGSPYQDQADSEVLVLGDSFLRIYQQDEPGGAGFIAHLAKELKLPLASLVSEGGASTLVRQELTRRPALLKNKRVLVWEFVERDIRLGTEGWQQVPLPSEPRAEMPVRGRGSNELSPTKSQLRSVFAGE
jgi:lysophospholipase L1-like esterase